MPVMEAPLRTQPVTIQEYRLIPEGRPFYELEQGELIEMASPKGEHQTVLMRLSAVLDAYIRQGHLGRIWLELDTELPNGNVYIPDLVFLRADRVQLYDEEIGNLIGAPDLVIEILSRYDHTRDTVQKFRSYQESGVQWYWIVNPRELTIEEYELRDEGYLCRTRVGKGESFESKAFPGLRFNLATLLE